MVEPAPDAEERRSGRGERSHGRLMLGLPPDASVDALRRRAGALDDLEQLVEAVALPPRELDQLVRPGDDGAALGAACDGDAAAAAEVEQPLVAQDPQGAQNGIRVDPEHGGEVARRRQPLARPRLAVGDRAADLGSHLLVQVGRRGPVELAPDHGATYHSFIVPATLETPPPAAPPPPDIEALIEEARRRQRRRRIGIAVAGVVAVGLAAAIWFLLVRGGGPEATDSGGGAPSVAFHEGWIFHERREMRLVPYPGAGHFVTLTIESWQQTSPPYRKRSLDYGEYWAGKRVESSSADGRMSYYDPATSTIYEDTGGSRPFVDAAANARRSIESGRWKVTRTTLAGRPVLRYDDEPYQDHDLGRCQDVSFHAHRLLELPLRQPKGRKVQPACVCQGGYGMLRRGPSSTGSRTSACRRRRRT